MEIILQGVEDDGVIFFGGDQIRPLPIFLSGMVRLMVSKPIEIRRINIQLMGKIRLNVPISQGKMDCEWGQQFIRFESYFFNHCWNKLFYHEVNREDCSLTKCTEKMVNNRGSHSCFENLFTKLKLVRRRPNDNKTILDIGEHMFSFSLFLPEHLSESIHNHPNTFVAYQIAASIQQVGNRPDLRMTRQLFLFRKISLGMLDYQHTEYAEVSLKDKVIITVALPWKIAALGSEVDILFNFKSKDIDAKMVTATINLCEYSWYQYKNLFSHKRRSIHEINIQKSILTSQKLTKDEDLIIEWCESFKFPISNNLGQITQDCSVLGKIKIFHALDICIFVNLSNHKLYRLNIHLPIYLYISPFIPLRLVKRDYFRDLCLHLCQPPIESDDPLTSDGVILNNNNINNNNEYGQEVKILNSDVIAKGLLPTSYDAHIHDTKIELPAILPSLLIDNIDNKTIIKYDSRNMDHLLNCYDIRYQPPSYEQSLHSNVLHDAGIE